MPKDLIPYSELSNKEQRYFDTVVSHWEMTGKPYRTNWLRMHVVMIKPALTRNPMSSPALVLEEIGYIKTEPSWAGFNDTPTEEGLAKRNEHYNTDSVFMPGDM